MQAWKAMVKLLWLSDGLLFASQEILHPDTWVGQTPVRVEARLQSSH